MKSFISLTIILLSFGLSACGGTSGDSVSTSKSSSKVAIAAGTKSTSKSGARSARPSSKSDIDGDGDENADDYDYGHEANIEDRRAVTALVRRYYKAAAAADGVTGCALIYSLYAEEIPELYGGASGSPGLRGNTCAIVMTKLFQQNRRQLITDSATLKVVRVRVKRLRALVLMSFEKLPHRDILVHREHRAWKIDELLDTGLG